MNRSTAGCACALAGLVAVSLPAQTAVTIIDTAEAPARPILAGRTIYHFDFEESRINPFPVPRYWRRAQGESPAPPTTEPAPRARTGFPLWNEASLDYRSAAAGEGSVMLPASGGSTCLRLEPGVLPVFQGTDYRVSASVRTRGIEHARARLAARFLDAHKAPIPGSDIRGPLIGDQPAWVPTALDVPGDFPGAAFLQLDLELLQPIQFQPAVLGKHQAWPEDFAAAAWFDDVVVTQLPRIELSTSSSLNVVVGPARPEIKALVRDLTGEVLRARVTLLDIDDQPIDTAERALEGGEASWSWSPAVTAYGWYRCTLEVLSGGTRVGSADLGLAWLPEASAGPAHAQFGVVLEPDVHEHVRDTADLIRLAGVGAATLPVWTDTLTVETAPATAEALAPLIESFLRAGTRVTFALAHTPTALAGETRSGRDDVPAVFSRREQVWAPYLSPFAERFGQSVRRWQIGFPYGPLARRLPAALGEVRSFESFLSALVPGPVVAVPWPIGEALDLDALARPGAPDAVDATLPDAMDADAAAAFIADWHEPAPPAALDLTIPVPAGATRRASLTQLTLRAVSAAAAADETGCPVTMSVPQPWAWTPAPRQRVEPHPALALWRSLGDRLAGRRFAGDVVIAPGVRAMVFSAAPGRAGGLMVAWADALSTAPIAIEAFLGGGDIVAYDLFGNPTPVPTRTAKRDGPPGRQESRAHAFEVGPTPVFVEGVDVGLARFIASMRLDPPFASSATTRHELAIILTNPWDEPISGRITLVEPGGGAGEPAGRDRTWRVAPGQAPFAINPGGQVSLPITLTFSAMEEAGPKEFVADVDLEGRSDLGRLRLRTAFDIGLEELRLDLTSRFAPEPDGDDIVIEARVSNQGAAPATLELTAFAPPGAGFSRSRATISGLEPGQSAIRRFPFPGGASRLRGGRILVGVQDTASGARLNRSVLVEPPSDLAGVPDEPPAR